MPSEHESKAGLVRKYNHVVVSHTLSKAYGMAGVRFGYALAHETLIQYFRKIQMPWKRQPPFHGGRRGSSG